MSNKRLSVSRQRIRETGVAAVEFALVLPIFLLLVVGIVELAVAFYDQHVLTHASRVAVRSGIVLRSPRLPDATIQQIGTDAANALITFAADTPTVTVTAAHGVNASNGNVPNLSVTVSYQYTGLLLGPMLSVFQTPIVMSATTSMDYE
jgi:Flp pilus assembly protein TadG